MDMPDYIRQDLTRRCLDHVAKAMHHLMAYHAATSNQGGAAGVRARDRVFAYAAKVWALLDQIAALRRDGPTPLPR